MERPKPYKVPEYDCFNEKGLATAYSIERISEQLDYLITVFERNEAPKEEDNET